MQISFPGARSSGVLALAAYSATIARYQLQREVILEPLVDALTEPHTQSDLPSVVEPAA